MEIIHSKISELFKVPKSWKKPLKISKRDLLIQDNDQNETDEHAHISHQKIRLYRMRENVTISVNKDSIT